MPGSYYSESYHKSTTRNVLCWLVNLWYPSDLAEGSATTLQREEILTSLPSFICLLAEKNALRQGNMTNSGIQIIFPSHLTHPKTVPLLTLFSIMIAHLVFELSLIKFRQWPDEGRWIDDRLGYDVHFPWTTFLCLQSKPRSFTNSIPHIMFFAYASKAPDYILYTQGKEQYSGEPKDIVPGKIISTHRLIPCPTVQQKWEGVTWW